MIEDELPLLLARRWTPEIDPAGWWLSEKLDGVRAWWDGKRLLSRTGHPIPAPSFFTFGLPASPLDGELWAGRGQFQAVHSVVRMATDPRWRMLRFVVFDAPGMGGAFESRLQLVPTLLRAASYAVPLPHVPCVSSAHLEAEVDRVVGLGGEGMMLRKAGSLYETGRSNTLLKVKRHQDAEAVVVEHHPGTGRLEGQLGAVTVETPDGLRFRISSGLRPDERRNPPPIGSVATYRFNELTDAGVPRFAVWIGVRHNT